MRVMIKMIDDYVNHIKNTTSNMSLLARIYGMFTIKPAGLRKINIIVMQNTSNLRNRKRKDFEFDIKGSMHGRRSTFNFKLKGN